MRNPLLVGRPCCDRCEKKPLCCDTVYCCSVLYNCVCGANNNSADTERLRMSSCATMSRTCKPHDAPCVTACVAVGCLPVAVAPLPLMLTIVWYGTVCQDLVSRLCDYLDATREPGEWRTAWIVPTRASSRRTIAPGTVETRGVPCTWLGICVHGIA